MTSLDFDVLVIGAVIASTSVAYFLAPRARLLSTEVARPAGARLFVNVVLREIGHAASR